MKDPTLKLKYSIGLGDLIASILHSKWLGWLTKLITGNSSPCTVCSQRIVKLNKKFPIKVWRLFFKNFEERNNALAKDLEKNGYKFIIHPDGSLQASKFSAADEDIHKLNLLYNEKETAYLEENISREEITKAKKQIPTHPEELNNLHASPHAENVYRYVLVSNQESEIGGEYLVRTQIFKIT
jgi:hypothetical protein